MSSTAPVKSQSQPLHNFSLTYLKWGKNQASHQRCRKQPPSSQPKNNHHNHHHHGCSASEAESDSGSSHHQDQQYPNNNHNLVIRIPKVGKSEEAEENTGKPWNLRPRRGIMNNTNNSNNGGHGGFEVDDREVVMMNQNQNQNQNQTQYQPKSLRLRGLVEGENVEKKDRYKFSIPLSRDEIEEDFFAWTGSKPPRRPKKRNKTVQKHVDNAFPGLWLAGITLDSYDVPELPAKKKKK